MPIASILAIGNELLNGEVRDLNIFMLSQRLTHVGFFIDYAGIVRDEPDKIAAMLAFILMSQPDVLVCSGGLGPTEDDLTLSAIAQALDYPLVLNPTALEMVELHYQRLVDQAFLTHHGPIAAREKMATLPQGAHPLPNPVGTAPGVAFEHHHTCIYVLPGVPAELNAIVEDTIMPELRARFDLGVGVKQALLVHCDDEAELAPFLREVARRHPTVYLKSLAKPFPAASQQGLRVIATASAKDREAARRMVDRALDDLQHVVQAADMRVSFPTSNRDFERSV